MQWFFKWRKNLGNPLLRKLLIYLTTECGICQSRPIDTMIRAYLMDNAEVCGRCRILQKIVPSIFRLAKIGSNAAFPAPTVLHQKYIRNVFISLLRGIGLFGPRSPQPFGVPLVVNWEITSACNLRCIHCFNRSDARSKSNDMTTEQALSLIDGLNRLGVPVLVLSGGEPFLRDDLFQLLEKASQLRFSIYVFSNGTLITRRTAKRLAELNGVKVQISLDGANAESHDNIRGVSGAYQLAIRGIENCLAEGIPTSIVFTMTGENIDEIHEFFRLTQDWPLAGVVLQHLIPIGQGKNVPAVENMKRLSVLEYTADTFVKHFLSGDKLCFSVDPNFLHILLRQLRHNDCGMAASSTPTANIGDLVYSFLEFLGGCFAGLNVLTISSDGYVLPCEFLRIKLGHVQKDDLGEVWLRNHVLNRLRDRKQLTGNCGACKYISVCGGCRASAYALNNDYMGEDPGCLLSLAKVGKKRSD